MEERRGFVQLTGEIGTGKTMMLDALVLGLDARTKVARLSHTTITADEIFELLIMEFGLERTDGGKLHKLGRVQGFLDEWTKAGRNSVLVVDEAQNLSFAVLEEIRLLSNLRSQGQCSLQIVLAGQPEFRAMLDREDMRQLKQRIGIRYHLTPLSARETGEYIFHRLAVAGSEDAKLFDKGAVDAVYSYAGGVPRMINIVCDRALVAGYGANKRRIGRPLIEETIRDLEGAEFEATRGAAQREDAEDRRAVTPTVPTSAPAVAAAPARGAWTPPADGTGDGAVPGRGFAAAGVPIPPETGPEVPFTAVARPEAAVSSRPAPAERPATAAPFADTGGRRQKVIGASIAQKRVPAWTLPAVVVLGALAVVVFSGVRSEWWRVVAGSSNEAKVQQDIPAVRSDLAAPEQELRDSAGSAGSVAGVVGDLVERRVEEAGAVEGEESGHTSAEGRPVSGAPAEEPVASGPASGSSEAEPGVLDPAPSSVATSSPDEVRLGDTGGAGGGAGGQRSGAAGPDVAPTRSLTSGPGGAFRAVALSSRSSDAARDEMSRLEAGGFSAEVIPVDIGDGSTWYRVAVRGGYPTLDAARTAVEALRGLGYDGAWVHRES